MNPENTRVRVAFQLLQNEHGFPPVSVETLWTKPLGDDRYQIDNIPFYVENLAMGDIITASVQGGRLFFDALQIYSRHSTVQVIACDMAEVKRLVTLLEPMGCDHEKSSATPQIVIDVPPEARLHTVTDMLDEEEDDEKLFYKISADRHLL